MASVELVALSDGHVHLEPDRSTHDRRRWQARRLSGGGDLGAVSLALIDGSVPRGRLELQVAPDADTATIHTMAAATSLVCRWGFNAWDLVVITWLGPTDPIARAVVSEAGFRVHPLPHRQALDGARGMQDAWFADLVPGDTRASTHRPLTAREQHVLTAMSSGRSNAQIAHELGISENTVKNHVRSILEMLQAPSRTAAVIYALRTGLVSLDFDNH